jgi:hypothetical protein
VFDAKLRPILAFERLLVIGGSRLAAASSAPARMARRLGFPFAGEPCGFVILSERAKAAAEYFSRI